MPNIGLGLSISNQVKLASSIYTPEYQAILNKATSISATQPSDYEKTLQNLLVTNLISNGIWNKLDAFYMFANNPVSSGSYDGRSFALINWIKPTANYGTASTSFPSISAISGFTGNGSPQAVDLNLAANAGVNFSSPAGSFGVFVGTVETVQNPIMAATLGTNRIRNSSTGASQLISGSTIAAGAVIFSSNSFIHLNVKNPTGSSGTVTVYRNGTGTNGTYASWVADTANFFVLRNSGAGASYGTSQVKIAFVGGDLSGQASAFSGLMNDYITQLSEVVGYASYSAMSSALGYTTL